MMNKKVFEIKWEGDDIIKEGDLQWYLPQVIKGLTNLQIREIPHECCGQPVINMKTD